MNWERSPHSAAKRTPNADGGGAGACRGSGLPGRDLGFLPCFVLFGTRGGAQQDDRADGEQSGRHDVDHRLGQQRQDLADEDRDHGLNEERRARAQPDPAARVARRQHERRHEGLVGELDGEHQEERGQHDREIHVPFPPSWRWAGVQFRRAPEVSPPARSGQYAPDMSGFVGDPALRDGLVVAGVLLGLLGVWSATRAHRKVTALRARLAVLEPSGPKGRSRSILDMLADSGEDMADLRGDVQAALDELDRARQEAADAIRHVAVVRYDAPGAVARHQSFSLALLDAEGDGVVISTITEADGSRTYAKIVTRGHGDFALAPEEREAVALARGEQDAAVRRRP